MTNDENAPKASDGIPVEQQQEQRQGRRVEDLIGSFLVGGGGGPPGPPAAAADVASRPPQQPQRTTATAGGEGKSARGGGSSSRRRRRDETATAAATTPSAPRLRSWTPSTTHLLLPPSSSNDNNPSPAFDVLDHAFGRSFPSQLRDEIKSLQESGLIERNFRPAKTAMDAKVDGLLLGLAGLTANDGSSLAANGGSADGGGSSGQHGGGVRGDRMAFLPRSLHRPNLNPNYDGFARDYPGLCRLVGSIEWTAMEELGGGGNNGSSGGQGRGKARSSEGSSRLSTIELDPSQTSVQIATYPGDNISGYPRHCDRGEKCVAEDMPNTPDSTDDIVKGNEKTTGRIITAVYYLTPDDWDDEEDGGALRVYEPGTNGSRSSGGTSNGSNGHYGSKIINSSSSINREKENVVEPENDYEKEDGEECGNNGDGSINSSSCASRDYYDVTPYSDRLIVFRSDLVEHEVLPSKRRERMAVTAWLYGRKVVVATCDEDDVDADTCDDGTSPPVPPMPQSLMQGAIRDAAPQTTTKEGMNDGKIERPPAPVPAAQGPPPLPLNDAANLSATAKERATAAAKPSKDELRIFASIPSYRDDETYPTIVSLVSNAFNPTRVYVGVVWQVDTSPRKVDASCFDPPLPPPTSTWAQTNLRALTMDYRHAAGPCPARALAQGLHRGEEYLLQIDSHMRFRPNWDSYLIDQLDKCPNPDKAVLTAYPPGYTIHDYANGRREEIISGEVRGTVLVPWKFDEDGMLRQKGRLVAPNDGNRSNDNDKGSGNGSGGSGDNDKNIPCPPLYAAGFNFSSSSVLKVCPYDGTLRHLFFGEETSMAVRLYTHGYDFFAPPQTVCYHLWSRDHRPTVQADCAEKAKDKRATEEGGGSGGGKVAGRGQTESREEARAAALDVVRAQLRESGPGLGRVRTVEEFASAVGVDFDRRCMLLGSDQGGLDPGMFAPPLLSPLLLPSSSDGGGGAADEEGSGAGATGRCGVTSIGDADGAEVAKLVAAFLGGA